MVNNIGVSLELVDHGRRDRPGRDRRVLRAREPSADLGAVHRRRVRRQGLLHAGLAGRGARTVLRPDRRRVRRRRRRGDQERPPRRPEDDVLRAGHVDRHRAADVHRLRARDPRRRTPSRPTSAAPIEEIINQQAGSGRHENRCRRCPDEHPGLPAGQHPGGDAADLLDGTRQHAAVLPRVAARLAQHQDADLRGDRPVAACRPCCCCRRSSTRRRSTTSSASRRCCSSSSTSCRPSACSSASAGARSRPPSPAPSTSAGGACRSTSPRWWCFLAVAVALLFLPQFTSNKWVFLGVLVVARGVWWATGLRSRLRSGDAGSDYAKTHV